MPAPAVIPAPIAYIKVVAVKKLVVGVEGLVRLGRHTSKVARSESSSLGDGPCT